jgi:IclR helix-turn-helix domain.
MSTQAQRVYDAVFAAAGFPLQAIDIAERTGDPQASVRRTLYGLVNAGKVAVKDNQGTPWGSPRYIPAPASI